MTRIVHIVMFEFKAGTDASTVSDLCQKMLQLRQQCVHPETQQPYIKASIGGSDNSPEGMQGGLTHAFVVDFDSEEDRRYYIEEDQAHAAFVKSAREYLAQARVIDFTPGVF